MIQLIDETLVPVGQAAKHVPGRPHIASIYRWMQRPTNPLETILVGGRRFTSVQAIHRFIESCNPSPNRPTPTASRAREIAAAEAELAKVGI